MSKLAFLGLLQFICAASFSQSLPFDVSKAVHFQRTNLFVRWEAPRHPWPETLWTYRVTPTGFSGAAVSNLMALGHFAETDKQDLGPGTLVFSRSGRTLQVVQPEGRIDYSTPYQRGMAEEVPGTNQLVRLTTNFLEQIGISAGESAGRTDGRIGISWPDSADSYSFFYPGGGVVISNIQSRRVLVRRVLDGVEFKGEGGDCQIEFGGHGEITSLRLCWRRAERDKLYASATPDRVTEWVREGKAVQKVLLTGYGGEAVVDWRTVKSLTVKTARAYYWGELLIDRKLAHEPLFPCWARPYIELTGTVDTGTTSLHVEIVCPIIDETKPLNGRDKR